MAELTLAVIAKDSEGVCGFIRAHNWADRTYCYANYSADVFSADTYCYTNYFAESLSSLGNSFMDEFPADVFGLCHADVIYGRGAIEQFINYAMDGNVCGIVGADSEGVYHCANRTAREHDGTVWLDGPGPVSCLDSMAVFFRPDLGLRFDEQTFDGFHCHVEDLCLQAHARGIPVIVPPADAQHRNHQQGPGWVEDYHRYRARLVEKWRGVEFRTT